MKLSDRLEALIEPCRVIDMDIAEAIGCRILYHQDNPYIVEPCDISALGFTSKPIPEFTSNIDAAKSLIVIPDMDNIGAIWSAEEWTDNGINDNHVRATVWVFRARRVYAASVAIGTCVAALRARGL